MPSLQIGHMQFEKSLSQTDKEKWFSLEKRRQKALSDKNSSWNFVLYKKVNGAAAFLQQYRLRGARSLTDSFDSWLLKKDGFDRGLLFAPVVA